MNNSRYRQGITKRVNPDNSTIYHLAASAKNIQVGRGMIITPSFRINGNYNQITCGVLKNKNGRTAVGYSNASYFIGSVKELTHVFVGTTKNQKCVQGLAIQSTRQWYNGSFKERQYQSGTVSADNFIYTGWTFQNKFKGYGQLLAIIGMEKCRIKGHFNADSPPGKGQILQVKQNEIYCGGQLNNEFSGEGTWLNDYSYYIGELFKGKQHGKGIRVDYFHKRDNQLQICLRYDGLFEDNLKSPQGVINLQLYTQKLAISNSDRLDVSCCIWEYCGEFSNDLMKGNYTFLSQRYNNRDCTKIYLKANQFVQVKIHKLNNSCSLKSLFLQGFKPIERFEHNESGSRINGIGDVTLFKNEIQQEFSITQGQNEITLNYIRGGGIVRQAKSIQFSVDNDISLESVMMNFLVRSQFRNISSSICGMDAYKIFQSKYDDKGTIHLTHFKHNIDLKSFQSQPDPKSNQGQVVDGGMNNYAEIVYANGDTYKGQHLNEKGHGYGIYSSSTVHYEGYWENDLYSGYGVLTEDIKDEGLVTYKGMFLQGDYHGQGLFINSRFQYLGEFKFDKINGQGTKKFENGAYLQGEFVNLLLVHGIHVVPSIYKYSGTFNNELYHGKGRLEVLNNHYTYQGDFLNDEIHGRGIAITSDYIYEGDYQHNLLHGRGRMYWYHGGFYEGEFLKGQIRGFGKLLMPKGHCLSLSGQFIDCQLTGYGEIVYHDGRVYTGELSQGQPHGQGKLVFKEIYEYNGLFKNGLYNGYGTIIQRNVGVEYSGEFVDDDLPYGVVRGFNARYNGQLQRFVQHGVGKIQFRNGDILEGQWLEGELQGQVIVSNENGTVYEGCWLNNRPNGMGVLKWIVNGNNYFRNLLEGNISGQTIEYDQIGDQIITKTQLVEEQNDNLDIQYAYDGIWQNGQYMYGKLYAQGKCCYEGFFIDNRVEKTNLVVSNATATSSDNLALTMKIYMYQDQIVAIFNNYILIQPTLNGSEVISFIGNGTVTAHYIKNPCYFTKYPYLKMYKNKFIVNAEMNLNCEIMNLQPYLEIHN